MELAVISGKGGTGKSSISAAFATLEGRVTLADCDVDAANLYLIFSPSYDEEKVFTGGEKAAINYSLCTNCGLCIGYCRFDAITFRNEKVEITDVSCDGCRLCMHICPEKAIAMVQSTKSRLYSGSFRYGRMVYGRLAPGEENSGKLVNMVREKAKQVSEEHNIETIILDGPPGIGCPVISTITGADKVIIITEPSVSGLHDLQRSAEIVRKFNISPQVIINKYDQNTSVGDQIEKWCISENIEVAGKLPFDENITLAMVECKSIIEYNPELGISQKIKLIWNRIKNQKK
ncbi:MAG: 4Fe-4S binding protein [Bacteroidales bacterium]|nr:4Fe-4S binding protein [Bacteroidales bacterium]